MRTTSLLFAIACGASLCAQSPLTALTGGTNSGNPGGGLYFDITVNQTITITQIDIKTGDPTAVFPQSNTPVPGPSIVDIYLGPSTYVGNVTNAALWAPVATGTGNVAMSTVVPFTLTTPLTLGPGSYGVALKSLATVTGTNQAWGFGYTNGAGCTSTTTPGACTNSLFTRNELVLRAGAAQNAFLTGGVFTPRVFNGAIHYTLGGTPVAVAAWENYGDGCIKSRTSFHELFPNPVGWDLTTATAGATVTMALGQGYTVSLGGTPFTPPSPTASAAVLTSGNQVILASAVLGAPLTVPILYPDGTLIGIADDLEICTEGYITPILSSAPVGNPRALPSITNFYAGAPRWAPLWKDLDPFTLGNITVELDATNNLIVSWNGVADPSGATSTSSFQVAFLANGNVEYRYAPNISIGGGGNFPILIGFTTGGNALQNEIDVSQQLIAGFQTGVTDNQELTQIMTARPRLGTTPSFTASNAPVGTLFGASMMSFVQHNPGLPLAGLGAPGCFQYQGAEVTQAIFTITNGSFSQPFPIPNTIAFNGVVVLSQSAAFVPGVNPLNLLVSNGTRMLIGSL